MVDSIDELDSAGNRPADEELTKKFLQLSGYKVEAITGSNQARRTFVTSNGGKYAISKSLRAIRTIQGPDTPKARRAAVQAEEDDD